jgi:hypothetical protein
LTEAETEGVLDIATEECHFKEVKFFSQSVVCFGVMTNRDGKKLALEREYEVKMNREDIFYTSPNWNDSFFIKSDWDLF